MPLQDSSERTITTLRVSVTDRCNLRCQYCMPEDGVTWIPHTDILKYEEIERIIKIAVHLGITRVRLTGGEPLLRRGIITFIKRLNQFQGLQQVILTTNGLLLPQHAASLRQAGIAYLNISLDTLNKEKFHQITRFDKLEDVLKGIQAAKKAGFPLVKVNVVSIRNFNDDEIFDFVRFAHAYDVIVRFIEYMPFSGNSWKKKGYIPSQELQERLKQRYTLLPLHGDRSAPAQLYTIPGLKGRIGFISPVSQSFCATCNRLRLTSDGYLRPCLHGTLEVDIKGPMRQGARDTEIAALFRKAIEQKPTSHQDFLDHCYQQPEQDREMVRIGG